MKAEIGISDKNRQASALLLNTILADEYILYTKTRNYHWNVVGPSFQELHKFFEEQYSIIDESIDEIAERVRMLNHNAVGSLKDILKLARLTETKEQSLTAKVMLQNLLDDHEQMIRVLREAISTFAEKNKDLGNSDFVTGLMEQHEKMAWMLRSYVQ